MKYLLFILMSSAVLNLSAQTETSIEFEKKLSWPQIQEKAAKDGKYIFIDAFTTWCIPCKEMELNVFTNKDVADFFNKNFINISVQMDTTKNDNQHTRNWRKQARAFAKDFLVSSYPTYLFVNSNGSVVHRIAGSLDATVFLERGKMALDPKTQLVHLKSEYTMGRRDSTFLLTLINTAKSSGYQDSLEFYINSYLTISNNWKTRRNLEFIIMGTKGSKDIAFKFLSTHQVLVDSVLGPHTSLRALKRIAYDEIVFPSIRKNGKKQVFGGGMTIYSGEIIKDVNWDVVKSSLAANYSDIADEVMLSAKPQYYEAVKDWKAYCRAVDRYISNTRDLNLYQLDNYARIIMMSDSSADHIKYALSWSKVILSKSDIAKTPGFLKTYSSLLYQDGQKKQAIRELEKYLSAIRFPDPEAQKELSEMRAGVFKIK